MEEKQTEDAPKDENNVRKNDKLGGCLTASIVGIFLLLIIYLSVGIFKFPTSLGKAVLSFNSRDHFDFTYLELLINNTPILTWPFNDIDSIEVERNVEDVFSKAAFIEKSSMKNGIDSTNAYSSYLKLINDESKDHPLTFPIISKIMFKNTLSFSNDSLFLRKIVNRCKNDVEVQFFCDNVIGTMQYIIVAHNSVKRERKWSAEILGYFSNKYIDFLTSIFMDYTGYVAEKNVGDKIMEEPAKANVEKKSLKENIKDVVEIANDVKTLIETTSAIAENSIQAYKNIRGNIERDTDSASFDSASDSILNKISESPADNLSEIQDVQSLDLPEP